MAKPVYCSECGMKLSVTLKALKGYGRIINLVDPHECAEEPIPLDLTPDEVPVEDYKGDRKFVQNLNELPATHTVARGQVSTADLADRRPPDQIKSTAPASIIEQMRQQVNTNPEGDINKEPDET